MLLAGGRTRIDRGLDEVTVVLYNQRYNWLGFKKYLFVISDGKQTRFGRSKPNLKERTWLVFYSISLFHLMSEYLVLQIK